MYIRINMKVNQRLIPLLSQFLLCILFVSCSASQKGKQPQQAMASTENDLSTDEGVLKELNRIHNKEFSKDYVCIQRPNDFPDLILVAMFAHDRGCMGTDAFFLGEFGTISNRSVAILEHAGWKLSANNRERLARAWFNDVHCAWRSPITTKPEAFPEARWFNQEVRQENDLTIVRGWVKQPSGMRPEAVYKAEEVRFNKDGSIESVQRLEEYIHEFK